MRLPAPKLFLTLVLLVLSRTAAGVLPKETSTSSDKKYYLDSSRVIGYRNLPEFANQLGLLGSSSAGLGLAYQHTRYYSNLTSLNIGGQFTFNAHYGAFIDHQWMVSLGKSYEPFVRVGGGALFSLADEFAGFIKKERYHLRLTAGFEDLFRLDRQLRSELLVAVAIDRVTIGLGLFYAFEDWSDLWF
jgi:hypothetical protein